MTQIPENQRIRKDSMKYSRFEDLPVWKASIEYALNIFEFTRLANLRGLGDTKNQLERSVLSISNNIAEGFERGTTTELIHFLYIARGSAGESRSMLCLCEKVAAVGNFKSEISNLKLTAESISRQLHGWIESLKNSGIKGTKFLTQEERDRQKRNKEFEEFDREMEKFRQEHVEWLRRREESAAAQRTASDE